MLMIRLFKFFLICIMLSASGCATLKEKLSLDADQVTEEFFHGLKKADKKEAYALLSDSLTQKISYDQFEGLIDSIENQWGKIQEVQSALMPFHERPGEDLFIPPNTPTEKIKRYVFDVQFQNALINVDLTLAPQGDEYRIYWLSFWGSSIYMTPDIKDKIEELFSSFNNLKT